MEEYGARFEVDVRRGHKTGFFLDQRENRRRVRECSHGKEVLDLFCYTGGFAVSAALGGAARVVGVDQAALAVQACARNFQLNGLDAEIVADKASPATAEARGDPETPGHRLHVADCWEFLEDAARRGERFDVVVNDPPSMAPRASARARALRAYGEVNRLALDVLRPGGLLVSCSCSSHVSARDLEQIVLEAGREAGRRLVVEGRERAATDHPVRKGFPEGDYLQALFVRAE